MNLYDMGTPKPYGRKLFSSSELHIIELRLARLEEVANAARHFVRSVYAPSESGNLAKSPVASYLFAQDLDNKLKLLDGAKPEGD